MQLHSKLSKSPKGSHNRTSSWQPKKRGVLYVIQTFFALTKSTASCGLSGVNRVLHATITPEGTKAHIMPADTVPFRPPTNSFEQVSPCECRSLKRVLKSSPLLNLWISAGRHVTPGRSNSFGVVAKRTTDFLAIQSRNLYALDRETEGATRHQIFGRGNQE